MTHLPCGDQWSAGHRREAQRHIPQERVEEALRPAIGRWVGIARPGSAHQASATALTRRRPESGDAVRPGAAWGLQPKPPQSPKQLRVASAGAARVSIAAASAKTVGASTRPQSARPVMTTRAATSGGNRPGSARLFASPARKLMERQRPTTAPTLGAAASARRKAQVAVKKITVAKGCAFRSLLSLCFCCRLVFCHFSGLFWARFDSFSVDRGRLMEEAGMKTKDLKVLAPAAKRERPSSARPVLESYAFAAQA